MKASTVEWRWSLHGILALNNSPHQKHLTSRLHLLPTALALACSRHLVVRDWYLAEWPFTFLQHRSQIVQQNGWTRVTRALRTRLLLLASIHWGGSKQFPALRFRLVGITTLYHLILQSCSPFPELSFLPAPYRGWTRSGERRVQDNLHAHTQNEPIKNY